MGFGKRFGLNLYYGMLILGSNEIGPVNTLEMLVCSIFLIFATFFNVFIIGDIISLMMALNSAGNEI